MESKTDKTDLFSCKECGKSMSTKHGLNGHMKLHENPKFSCDMRGKKFFRGEHLRNHYRIHTEPNRKDFKCDICQKEMANKYNMIKHIKIHDKTKTFPCDLCTKIFTNSRPPPGAGRESVRSS